MRMVPSVSVCSPACIEATEINMFDKYKDNDIIIGLVASRQLDNILKLNSIGKC